MNLGGESTGMQNVDSQDKFYGYGPEDGRGGVDSAVEYIADNPTTEVSPIYYQPTNEDDGPSFVPPTGDEDKITVDTRVTVADSYAMFFMGFLHEEGPDKDKWVRLEKMGKYKTELDKMDAKLLKD